VTSRGNLAARAQLAHERAAEIVQKHASEETAERIAELGSGSGGYGLGRDPLKAQVLHAELIDALAEIVDELASASGARGRKRSTK
jgi:hypothetical protein